MIDENGVLTTTYTSHEWIAADGEKFACSRWGDRIAAGQPRLVVVAIHGLSGAALDFEPLGAHLATLGIVTFAPELRGQGNDPVITRRGDLLSPEQWFSDLSEFFALVRSQYPDVPIFYYGESLGGALLTRFVAQAETKDCPTGLVLASPVVVLPGNPGWWQRFVFHLCVLVAPQRRIDVSKYTSRDDENDPAKWVTRDAGHRRWFATASHKITSFTFRFFKCVFDIIGGCYEAAEHITVPVLVIYAAKDVYIPPTRVEGLFNRMGSRDKEIQIFPDSYHLLLHDYDKAKVLHHIENWLLSRIAKTL